MSSSWRVVLNHLGTVFVVAAVGCASAFALWLHDLSGPQAVFLGSGNRLSLLVSEGPARLVVASGDDPIAFENAFSSLQPLFARRVDLLLVAGSGESLLVPLTAQRSPHVRSTYAVAPLTPSPESAELGPIATMDLPARIRLGPTVTVTIETAPPPGADPSATFPAWRATVARGDSRVVLLSDGSAAPLFPPTTRASVLAVSGNEPLAALESDPSVSFVANAETIDGPEFRQGLASHARHPAWGARVAAGEVLRVRFTDGAIEFPSDAAQPIGFLNMYGLLSFPTSPARLVRRSARPSRR